MIINLTVEVSETEINVLGDMCDEEGEPLDGVVLTDEQRARIHWEIGRFLEESFREEEEEE